MGDADGNYAKGNLTGDGGSLVASLVGQLLAMSGMRVSSNGRLRDNMAFAVAGVVHEGEYVIPKWELQDPQVAAASPASDGEKLYAVQTQMLDESRTLERPPGWG